jgi:hypothetical protein
VTARPVSVAALAGIAIAAAACGGLTDLPPSPTDVAVPIELSAERYTIDTASGVATVSYVLGNRTGRMLYGARCGAHLAAALDRWNGAAWIAAEAGTCPDGMEPVVVGIGIDEIRRDARPVASSGVFRMRVGTTSTPGGQLAWEHGSAAFEVR